MHKYSEVIHYLEESPFSPLYLPLGIIGLITILSMSDRQRKDYIKEIHHNRSSTRHYVSY